MFTVYLAIDLGTFLTFHVFDFITGLMLIVSPQTYIYYEKYSNVAGEVNTWKCYNTNKSAQGIKWYRKDNYHITILMKEATTRTLNFTVHPSHNRHIYMCEINGERASSSQLDVTSKLLKFVLILWSNTSWISMIKKLKQLSLSRG